MDVCLQDFDINRLLTEARERSMPAADLYGNALDLSAPGGLGQMHSDFTKVRQTLLNLLDNACKFTQDGTVTLSAEKVERDGAAAPAPTPAVASPPPRPAGCSSPLSRAPATVRWRPAARANRAAPGWV